MTNDIVTRLRIHRGQCDLLDDETCIDATHEIFKLRRQLSETQTQLAYWREIAFENQTNG